MKCIFLHVCLCPVARSRCAHAIANGTCHLHPQAPGMNMLRAKSMYRSLAVCLSPPPTNKKTNKKKAHTHIHIHIYICVCVCMYVCMNGNVCTNMWREGTESELFNFDIRVRGIALIRVPETRHQQLTASLGFAGLMADAEPHQGGFRRDAVDTLDCHVAIGLNTWVDAHWR